jgi:hypothetical protein
MITNSRNVSTTTSLFNRARYLLGLGLIGWLVLAGQTTPASLPERTPLPLPRNVHPTAARESQFIGFAAGTEIYVPATQPSLDSVQQDSNWR